MPSSVYYGGTGTQIVSGKPSALDYSVQASKVASLQALVGSSSSEGMRGSIASLQTAVEALQTVVGDSSGGLVKRVSDLENA